MSVTTLDVENSLRQCMDPEVPLNIVEMGLVYGIDVKGSDVDITMTMTTQGCPLHDTIIQDVTRYAKKVPGVDNVNVKIVWDPPWSMDKMTADARDKIKNMTSESGSLTPFDYDIAMPQGVGKLATQEDGSMVLLNNNDQGFMVNQAIVDFWKCCNGQRKMTELVDVFANNTGLQRASVEKEVAQLVRQLHGNGLVTIPDQHDTPNVTFKS
ncbi:MAG: DUF59 domain-containing protein [Cenarchaeum sp. SB0665_bin_23]|nr:DUF59 domain-containing protein [Cenarchaeum sp. SB0667_bin_13]MXY37392.1 DUF59 domain-containing protein [Cenarchaeum sp. SB0664_bin_35]MXY60530.1 DUF59 domain-containing protein [Cenarchaeum sp. SB0665_bin_23]MXZ92966.1 DUF59 domain-containing protein [Cenarchaeum sp. SB0666_bin_15]MYB46588.1 DUF59 domain-containing protein [Cenarchaeum sp. SB0662_bin_33]MYC79046.1 DUF59 domain-containing protein [Cenarchaeum sp. SB0661_bin_35]MYD58810.1 DUF59 domain-containing protein [Cenarchaeum sp. S